MAESTTVVAALPTVSRGCGRGVSDRSSAAEVGVAVRLSL